MEKGSRSKWKIKMICTFGNVLSGDFPDKKVLSNGVWPMRYFFQWVESEAWLGSFIFLTPA
jgi:hypothetical protein